MSRSSRGLGHRPFTAVTGVRTPYGTPVAGIAQLVEHNLAKVGVGSSSLLSRSKFSIKNNDLKAPKKFSKIFINKND